MNSMPENQARITLDFERLKEEIADAFFLSGSPQESWLAEEMAAGVEFSLSRLSETERQRVSRSTVRELVASLLSQTGFRAAADVYLELESQKTESPPDSIHHILQTANPRINAQALAQLVIHVENAIRTIGISFPTRELVEALGVNLQFEPPRAETTVHPVLPKLKINEPQLMMPEELLNRFPPELTERLASGIVSLLPLSRVFPVLRLRVDLLAMAQQTGMVFPLTELSLMPALLSASRTLNATAAAARTLLERTPETLPLELVLGNTTLFSQRCLNVNDSETAVRLLLSLGSDLSARLTDTPYKIRIEPLEN